MIRIKGKKSWKCRCNKRNGQHRKTLPKHPDEYKRGRPKCHVPGCKGLMYALKDQSGNEQHCGLPVCDRGCLPYPHKINSKQCEQYEDYIIDRSLK